MKRYRYFFIGLMAAMLFAGCAQTTFLISKDGRAYYMGRKSEFLHTMLCKSGDLEKILSEISIPEDLKKDLYRYNCTDERSKEKIVALYLVLTPEEKEDFKSAFRRHDYSINYVPC